MISSTIFTTDLKPEEITIEVAKKYIQRHKNEELPRLIMLRDYYMGNHPILTRSKPSEELSNIKLVANHAAYIANFTNAYLIGEPVSYTAPDGVNIDGLMKALKKADSTTQDSDLALDLAKYGRAYELTYMSSDEKPVVKFARISPETAFVVYDDTVEQNPVFGCYYYPYTDSDNQTRYNCTIVTAYDEKQFIADEFFGVLGEVSQKPHSFGLVPLNEFYNNGDRTGDYEQVLSLIDAYNIIQSDRVNDKEQFVNALLVLKGVTLGDTNEEMKETYAALKAEGVMQLPAEGADAAYLTRQFDEGSIETLRKSIEEDIYRFSCVPNMSDSNFAGNVSGVAMRYKTLALEQLAKIKERFFTEGLRYRLRLIQNILTVQGAAAVDLDEITITFKRSLPANELELAQMVTMLDGVVPEKTLLSLLPFVKDPEQAAEELEEEKAQAVEQQQSMFMNTPIRTEDEEEA